MILKFFAVEDLLVDVPGGHVVGQLPRYVGREFAPPTPGNLGSFPATKEPYECDSDSAEGRRLAHICKRDEDLFPADDETAAFCGVKRVPIEFKDGQWVEISAPAKSAKSAPKESATND